jgi:hypothetical protein
MGKNTGQKQQFWSPEQPQQDQHKEAPQPDPYYQNDDDLEEERLDDIPVNNYAAPEENEPVNPMVNNNYNFDQDDVQEIPN